ncbi:Uma2 family endonuclease [Baaleninema sp.]|uniref:Uma2 family endonuclease n=1 Tax=Baaleninema sp. TaxID=3101197 RepID=UPI003D069E9E
MPTSLHKILSDIEYPDCDGLPMAESDAARDYLIYGTEALKLHFQHRSDVYVSGNLFIYYEQGSPKAVVAPDVFVVFGVEDKQRLSYKVWEENNKLPSFILEITSKSTRSEDQGTKKGLYAYLGIQEYFQYDPTADYLKPSLQGLRLLDGNYFPILPQADGSSLVLFSEVLGLELRRLQDGSFRFYCPETGERLGSLMEIEESRQAEREKSQKMAERLRQLGVNPEDL